METVGFSNTMSSEIKLFEPLTSIVIEDMVCMQS